MIARRPRLQGRPVRHAVQKAADRLALGDRVCLADEDEEGRLKGVLGVRRVFQDAPADAQDHRPVPADQRLEGVLVALGEEARQQQRVGERIGFRAGHSPQVLKDLIHRAGGHGWYSRKVRTSSTHSVPGGAAVRTFFSGNGRAPRRKPADTGYTGRLTPGRSPNPSCQSSAWARTSAAPRPESKCAEANALSVSRYRVARAAYHVKRGNEKQACEKRELWPFFAVFRHIQSVVWCPPHAHRFLLLESLPMFMRIACPVCGHLCRVPESALGKQVVCPACSKPFLCGSVSPPSLTARPLASEMTAVVQETPQTRPAQVQPAPSIHYCCARCKKPLESPAHLAGHKINCPDCGQRLQIPPAASTPPPSDNKTILATEEPPRVSVAPESPIPAAPRQPTEEQPILTVLPASPPAPAAPVRREYCLECGTEVTQRTRVQTCPDCGSLFCSARCYRDHCYHAHPRH
jgi:DNA-directed RNA polymerase subunit RPC12/RpoP